MLQLGHDRHRSSGRCSVGFTMYVGSTISKFNPSVVSRAPRIFLCCSWKSINSSSSAGFPNLNGEVAAAHHGNVVLTNTSTSLIQCPSSFFIVLGVGGTDDVIAAITFPDSRHGQPVIIGSHVGRLGQEVQNQLLVIPSSRDNSFFSIPAIFYFSIRKPG